MTMATLYEFPIDTPTAEQLRTAAESSGVSFSYTSIAYYGSSHAGYESINPSDLTQTETDNLTSAVESETGQSVSGPFTVSEIKSQ